MYNSVTRVVSLSIGNTRSVYSDLLFITSSKALILDNQEKAPLHILICPTCKNKGVCEIGTHIMPQIKNREMTINFHIYNCRNLMDESEVSFASMFKYHIYGYIQIDILLYPLIFHQQPNYDQHTSHINLFRLYA